MSSQGNEAQLDNSLEAADTELTKEDVNVAIIDDSNKQIAVKLRRQAANIRGPPSKSRLDFTITLTLL